MADRLGADCRGFDAPAARHSARCWVRAWLISRWWLPDRSPLGWLDCQLIVIQLVYVLKLLMLLCWNFNYSTNYFKFLAHETVCISVPRLRWSQQSAMHSTRNFFPCRLIVDEKNSIHSLNKAVKETEREGWWCPIEINGWSSGSNYETVATGNNVTKHRDHSPSLWDFCMPLQ